MEFDLDKFLSTPAEAITHKVGVAFDDDGEPTAGFVIVGKDSQQYRQAEASIQAKALTKGAHKNTRIDLKKAEDSAKFVGLIDEQNTARAVAVVVDMFGFTQGGQPIPFSAETVAKLFAAKPTWRDKVLAALEVEESFLPK